jgi:diacylglycerol kinase (ATP)
LYRQPVLIYNPAAGEFRRNPERFLQRTTAALARASLAPRLIATCEAGDATKRAREALAQGADLLLVLGGDGTINEVANGMVGSDTPLGILPGGTANCLAVEIGLGTRLEEAAERLVQSAPRSIALGRIHYRGADPRHFLLMCGAGFDGRVVYDVHSGLKRAAGKLAYWVAGFAQVVRPVEQIEVRVHGVAHACGFMLASRIRNYGGDLEIARGASLLRRDFEMVLFEGSSPLRYAWYMLGVAAKSVQNMPGVHTLHTRRAEITVPCHLQVDGEYLGRHTAVVDIVQDALRLLIPSTYG